VEDKMTLIKIKKLNPEGIIPKYAKEGDAAFDLYSIEDHLLKPMDKVIIKTGISMEIPQGHFGNIRDRSGLAAKHGLHTLAGVVDSGYRGEVGVVMTNLGKENCEIKKGDRIAQMLIQKFESVEIEEVLELSESVRGEGGFGSSGIK
jgi:dUTP pyrophosphatase